MRVAVHIPGHFLPLLAWEKVMWGEPQKGQFGAIPKALEIAEREHAELIFWCSSIPLKGDRSISPHALDYTIAHAKQLLQYAHLNQKEIADALHAISIFDEHVENTRIETEHAIAAFKKHEITKVFLVCPPSHVFRVHQEMLGAKAKDTLSNVEFCAIASDIDFSNSSVDQVAILEPSHRADQPQFQPHRYAKAGFEIQRGDEAAYEKYLQEWGDLLKKYGVSVDWSPRKSDRDTM